MPVIRVERKVPALPASEPEPEKKEEEEQKEATDTEDEKKSEKAQKKRPLNIGGTGSQISFNSEDRKLFWSRHRTIRWAPQARYAASLTAVPSQKRLYLFGGLSQSCHRDT